MRIIQSNDAELFCELPCLLERSKQFSGAALFKTHFKGKDKRQIAQSLQKFLVVNAKNFAFLGVLPYIVGTDQSTSLYFRTSNFIGTIPLRSPINGKPIGDFVVTPRFIGNDRYGTYIELLDLLGGSIGPEFLDDLPLASARIFRPPLYLEAVKFVAALEDVVESTWRKFDARREYSRNPNGNVLWSEYVTNGFKVENRLRFPLRRNVLSELHTEYGQLRYVFDICRDELKSNSVPARIRNSFRRRLQFIEEKLYLHKPVPTSELVVRASDPQMVRKAKRQGNLILRQNFVKGTAWRVDFNDVFEKFVQYVFAEVARTRGGSLIPNPRVQGHSSRMYGWELRHLEPDAIYRDGSWTVFIDAKYKSHLLNRYDDSEVLKADFRHDLHQVLAYSSFSETRRFAALCYPSGQAEIKLTRYKSRYSGGENSIALIGIPLSRDLIKPTVSFIGDQLEIIQSALLSQDT